MAEAADAVRVFSEKGFYLEEFRGRTLAFAAPPGALAAAAPLAAVIDELLANRTRLVLIAPEQEGLAALAGRVLPAGESGLQGAVWRALRRDGRAGVAVSGTGSFPRAACGVAASLAVAKLVWMDAEGGLARVDGSPLSFVDLTQLRDLLAAGRAGDRALLLREIESALSAGVPAVNLCAPAGVADELFTFAGSGTLFTRQRYIEVRRLSIDDFDAAEDLLARGVAEGYLAPRSPEQVEAVLGSGFGAFVEGCHLAGIGALLHHAPAAAGEIASLYTLTRFLGEGIGAHLVSFAVERARELGCRYAFACTTRERVAGFFARHGFREVEADDLPPEKWKEYDAARRERVRCLRRDLG